MTWQVEQPHLKFPSGFGPQLSTYSPPMCAMPPLRLNHLFAGQVVLLQTDDLRAFRGDLLQVLLAA